MELIAEGVLLWSLVHLSPRLIPDMRTRLIRGLGSRAYQVTFGLLILSSLGFIAYGWPRTPIEIIYQPPAWTRPLTMVLMAVSIVLFVSSKAPSDIRQVLRHPQLTAVLLWSVAHLLSNGESRSLLLFGGLALWALLEIWLINRAKGIWIRPGRFGAARTAVSTAIGLVVFAIVTYLHPWLSGVTIIG